MAGAGIARLRRLSKGISDVAISAVITVENPLIILFLAALTILSSGLWPTSSARMLTRTAALNARLLPGTLFTVMR